MHYACVAVCSGNSGCVLGDENPHVTERLRVLHPVLLNGAEIQWDCYHPCVCIGLGVVPAYSALVSSVSS